MREAELNLSYTSVAAPIAGVTGRALHSEGSLVTANTDSSLLTTVSQTNPVWVRFALSEAEHDSLRGVVTAMTHRRTGAGERRRPYEAHRPSELRGFDRRSPARHRAAACRIPESEDCTSFPGQFATVRIEAGTQQVITVPQTAVLQGNQGRFVWTVDADGKAAQRPVETGDVGRPGLDHPQRASNAGDTVIVDNLMKLNPGAAVDVAQAAAARTTQPAAASAATDMFSKFFIDRPVLAGVIAIVIVIAGLVASATLPLAQYPEIAPPTVVINASYPGASAETIAKTVAAPIEEQLSGVEHLLYFNSSAPPRPAT